MTTTKIIPLKSVTIGNILRSLREQKELLLREVAASISIDPTLLSKIERDERMPTRGQVNALATYYKQDENKIVIAYLSDKLFYELQDEDLALKAIQVAEKKIKHKRKIK